MRPELPTALKYLRQGLNLSQKEVAHKIKVARQMLISWEAGKLFPTTEHFKSWKGILIKELQRVQIQPGEVSVGKRKYKVKRYVRDEEKEEDREKENVDD